MITSNQSETSSPSSFYRMALAASSTVGFLAGIISILISLLIGAATIHGSTVATGCSAGTTTTTTTDANYIAALFAAITVVVSILYIVCLFRFKGAIVYKLAGMVGLACLLFVLLQLAVPKDASGGLFGPCFQF